MPSLSTDEIRRRWVDFFAAKGHKLVPSDSLVPHNDPSVLFTGAGMNQFKDHFAGAAKLEHGRQRAVSVQKCLRGSDIDNVGRTPNHQTFFEMLGNFSFGDYFKKEAIEWAWEFLTDGRTGLGLDKARLSVTVFAGDPKLRIEKDTEAESCWKSFAPELKNKDGSWRIYAYGEHDNFWPADAPSQGPNGPCGPCSEIYYDTKPEQGDPERVAESKDPVRYVEIWNLVFTQFNRVDVGKLVPLAQKNIDTGSGLERVARVVQKKSSNFEIDLLFPIVQGIAGLTRKQYGVDPESDRRMRRITDHARAGVFCIADGAAPKNEGRNYVVRRLLRRAILDGRELGITDPFLGGVARSVIKQMGVGYPELLPRAESLVRIMEEEENSFNRTLVQGRELFDAVVEKQKKSNRHLIPGEDAFRLWDTFGFPLELTTELAESKGLKVDVSGFNAAMEYAVKRSQAGSSMSKEIFAGGPVTELKKRFAGKGTEFHGYETLRVDATQVLAIVQNDILVEKTLPGGEALVLLAQTPFYAESGGQVGDRGCLCSPHAPREEGSRHAIVDTQKQEGLFLHRVKLAGVITVGDMLEAIVDPLHRLPTLKNHSATHLLHYALRQVLGTHVEQRGSLVAPDRLRFDFTHFEQIKPEQLTNIEARVNALIASAYPIETKVMALAEAKASGAMALFGEKYGDHVRVVSMGPSTELCGGTHCSSTGEIGYFRIVSEGSVASGVRRIEAFTGAGAVADARKSEELLGNLAALLKSKKEHSIERLNALQEEKISLEHALESLRKKAANAVAGDLLANVKDIAGSKLLLAVIDGADAAALRTTLDGVRKILKEGAVVLGGARDGKVSLIVSFSPELVKRGAHAGNLLKELAPKVGGKGGGKPDMAQGGGPDVARLPEALAGAEAMLVGMLASA